jgi:hypothetical protein
MDDSFIYVMNYDLVKEIKVRSSIVLYTVPEL